MKRWEKNARLGLIATLPRRQPASHFVKKLTVGTRRGFINGHMIESKMIISISCGVACRGRIYSGHQRAKRQYHTTDGIPRWSPTLVLVVRFSAYVWQSGRDAQFSLTYGRMCLIILHDLYVTQFHQSGGASQSGKALLSMSIGHSSDLSYD
jgi:hypothetical protein